MRILYYSTSVFEEHCLVRTVWHPYIQLTILQTGRGSIFFSWKWTVLKKLNSGRKCFADICLHLNTQIYSVGPTTSQK